jgi:hypothetical protein
MEDSARRLWCEAGLVDLAAVKAMKDVTVVQDASFW